MDKNNGDEFNTSSKLQRLKYFAYYLTQNVERNFSLCLELLEGRNGTKKGNSAVASAASALSTQIPLIGRGVSAAIKQGELFILDRIDKENSRNLAQLVYYYSDHKDQVRNTLIVAAMDIFRAYDLQFMQISCDRGGVKRAMQKMALDGSARILSHYLCKKEVAVINREDVGRGIVFGKSSRNKFGQDCGRAVTLKGVKQTTSDIYSMVGVFIAKDGKCWIRKTAKSNVLGYRRPFAWEISVDGNFSDEWVTMTEEEKIEKDVLQTSDEDFSQDEIAEYIINQNDVEAARYDRERKHQEAEIDRKEKHEETISCFNERFNQVVELLANQFIELANEQREAQKELIVAIKNAQKDDAGNDLELVRQIGEMQKKVDSVESNQEQAAKIIQTVDGVVKQVQNEMKKNEVKVKEIVQEVDKVFKNEKNNIIKLFEKEKKKKVKIKLFFS